MKKIFLAALVVITGTLASCKKEHEAKPQAPLHVLMGFKNDISTAD
ncbi:hypothetical protein LJ707_00220 [Mucilaginibacter sp. UR6-1]|nr:hypothetical protein [Mucilaginibacter sp. UR6-1]MCC8407336.1 hypothetical protein [Mucilaginibacter sp. UR6-1]